MKKIISIVFLLTGCTIQQTQEEIGTYCASRPDGEGCTWPEEKNYNRPVYLGICYDGLCIRSEDYNQLLKPIKQ